MVSTWFPASAKAFAAVRHFPILRQNVLHRMVFAAFGGIGSAEPPYTAKAFGGIAGTAAQCAAAGSEPGAGAKAQPYAAGRSGCVCA